MYGIPILLGFFAGVSASSRWEAALAVAEPHAVRHDRPAVRPRHRVLRVRAAVLPLASSASPRRSCCSRCCSSSRPNYLYGAIRVSGREVASRSPRASRSPSSPALYLLLQAREHLARPVRDRSPSRASLITGAGLHRRATPSSPGGRSSPRRRASSRCCSSSPRSSAAGACRSSAPRCSSSSSLLIGSLYPWVIQRFQVDPNAQLARGGSTSSATSTSTRDAYGLADVEEIPYEAKTDAEAGRAARRRRDHREHPPHGPAVDRPAVRSSSSSSASTTSSRTRSTSTATTIDGKSQDTVVAVRELNLDGSATPQTWYNSHLVYTHGYGLVAAAGNQRSADGQPGVPRVAASRRRASCRRVRAAHLLRRGLAAVLDRRRARGRRPDRARLPGGRATAATRPRRPSRATAGRASTTSSTELIYALKFQSEQIFLSDDVNDDSQILYDRDPIERVQKVAPYLELDSDAVPVGRRRPRRVDHRRLHA